MCKLNKGIHVIAIICSKDFPPAKLTNYRRNLTVEKKYRLLGKFEIIFASDVSGY